MPTENVAEAGQHRLASALTASGALTPQWRAVFEEVPRHWFIPDRAWARAEQGHGRHRLIDRHADPAGWWAAVYEDSPITTQFADGRQDGGDGGGEVPAGAPSSSNSMPSMVFSMLSALELDGPGAVPVLEIGTGTGWNAALMASKVGSAQVVTVEYDEQVAAGARAVLGERGIGVDAVLGDGMLGYPARAPFGRTIATCSVRAVPAAWIEQTRPGGLIMAPLGTAYGGEGVVRLHRQADGGASGRFVMSSAFMRLRQQRTRRFAPIDWLGGKRWPGDGDRSTTPVSPKATDDWITELVIGMWLPTLAYDIERYEGGAYTYWLVDLDGPSWATVDFVPGAAEFDVVQGGPRRLWDEVTGVLAWWQDRGRPGLDRFGLTVAPDGRHRFWLDDEEGIIGSALPGGPPLAGSP